MATRGRPPAQDIEREPNGRALRNAETMTPQLVARRRALGVDENDPRASYPLGILFARGAITRIDHAAALKFAALHQIVFGRRTPKSHLAKLVYDLAGGPSLHDDPERDRRVREAAEEYGRAWSALKALPTSRPGHVLENLAIHDRELRFMDTARARTPAAWAADQRDMEALQEATDALARHWHMGHYGDKAERLAAAG